MAEQGFNRRRKEFRQRAEELVSKMTVEEKVYQTLFNAPAIPRLGIKSYNWWNEALHGVARAGVATVFPQAIGLAASFDEDLLEEIADTVSTEARAKFNMQQQYDDTDIYKGLTFWSPNVNIFRDPRWGRGHETFGEDPYLTARLGVRFIEGMQGHDDNYMKVAACAKHFAVHSGPEGIRHSFNAEASKQDMYETYLPAFQACVQEAGVEAVMGAYNRTNGEPCCGSKTLLKDILRDEWGFEGHVTSDCWAIKDFHVNHKVTDTPVESVSLAMNNGCDLNCGDLFAYLVDAVKEGKVSEERLTEAVVNLYTTKMKLGIFDEAKNVPFSAITYDQIDTKAARELNLRAAKETLVLLKNDGLLPLDKSKLKTIGVIGPNANSRDALVGNYMGTASRYITVTEGIQDYVGDDVRVFYSEGCHLFKDKVENLGQAQDRLSEVKGVCEQSDVVVVCLGLDASLEGEEGDAGNAYASGDKTTLDFPGNQEAILEAAYASGKPVILVVLSGSALAFNWAAEHVSAIVQGWYPGAQGGRAIAEMLFGEFSPEGKLPLTFYKSLAELPEFTDYAMRGRTYRYMQHEPLYPFGYGLSYTDITVSDVQADTAAIQADGSVTVSAVLTNTGSMAGTETLQIYVKVKKDNTPNPQLKGIQKVHLAAGKSRKVTVTLPADAFGIYDEEPKKMLYAGEFTVYVGTSQPDARSVELTGKRPAELTITCAKTAVLYDPAAQQAKARQTC